MAAKYSLLVQGTSSSYSAPVSTTWLWKTSHVNVTITPIVEKMSLLYLLAKQPLRHWSIIISKVFYNFLFDSHITWLVSPTKNTEISQNYKNFAMFIYFILVTSAYIIRESNNYITISFIFKHTVKLTRITNITYSNKNIILLQLDVFSSWSVWKENH